MREIKVYKLSGGKWYTQITVGRASRVREYIPEDFAWIEIQNSLSPVQSVKCFLITQEVKPEEIITGSFVPVR